MLFHIILILVLVLHPRGERAAGGAVAEARGGKNKIITLSLILQKLLQIKDEEGQWWHGLYHRYYKTGIIWVKPLICLVICEKMDSEKAASVHTAHCVTDKGLQRLKSCYPPHFVTEKEAWKLKSTFVYVCRCPPADESIHQSVICLDKDFSENFITWHQNNILPSTCKNNAVQFSLFSEVLETLVGALGPYYRNFLPLKTKVSEVKM